MHEIQARGSMVDLPNLDSINAHLVNFDHDLDDLEHEADYVLHAHETFIEGADSLYSVSALIDVCNSTRAHVLNFMKYMRDYRLSNLLGRDFKKYPKALAKLADRMEDIAESLDPPLIIRRGGKGRHLREVFYDNVDVDFLFELAEVRDLAEDMLGVCDDMRHAERDVRDAVESELMRREDESRRIMQRW